jgi:hypothetical protein
MNSSEEFYRKIGEQMISRRVSLIAVVDRIGSEEMRTAGEIAAWTSANQRPGRLGQRHACMLPGTASDTALEWSTYVRGVADWLEQEQMVRPSFRRADALNALTPQHFWEIALEALEQGVSGDVIVLISGPPEPPSDMHTLYEAFARLRAFASEWTHSELSVHHVVVGLWSNYALQAEYEQAHTSWPFDAGRTLLQAPPWSVDDVMSRLAGWGLITGDPELHARYLWELTGGDPWAATAVAREVRTAYAASHVTCDELAAAAVRFAAGSVCQRELLRRYDRTSSEARAVLHRALQGGYVVGGRTLRRDLEELELLGWVTFEVGGDRRIGRLRSWVLEYALRSSTGALRSRLPASVYARADELLPPMRCLNQDAYESVCEIENLLRNLVVMRRHAADVQAGVTRVHPLVGQRTSTLMSSSTRYADEHARLEASRRHFLEDKGLAVTHAPLVSFSTTQPVLDMIEQMVIGEQDEVLSNLRKMIARDDLARFKSLRDAVAHNQMVSETARTFLRDLRARLVHALAV